MYLPRHLTEDSTDAAVAIARGTGFGRLVVA